MEKKLFFLPDVPLSAVHVSFLFPLAPRLYFYFIFVFFDDRRLNGRLRVSLVVTAPTSIFTSTDYPVLPSPYNDWYR